MKIEQTWTKLLADPPINHSDPNQWRKAADVRPSSFPFCPRRYVMMRLGLEMPDNFAVESCYYTEVGKAVHYVAQNALAQTGRLWGFWNCARPVCGKQLNTDKPSFFPEGKTCPACQSAKFEYHEVRLVDEEIGLAGHTDGVFVFKKHASILEIKTSDDDKVKGLKSLSDAELAVLFQTEAPWYGYWHQASTYAALVRERYGHLLPPLTQVDYLIFSRNSPKNMVAFSLDVPADNSWWAELRARIVVAQRAKHLKILPEGFAHSQSEVMSLPTCKYCTHADVCLSPQGKLRFTADALHDKNAKRTLDGFLEEERSHGRNRSR